MKTTMAKKRKENDNGNEPEKLEDTGEEAKADRYTVRFDEAPGLYDVIRRHSEEQLRSINGTILHLCKQALEQEGYWPPKEQQ